MGWDRSALDGVDLSAFQPEDGGPSHKAINWVAAIGAGLKFAVARASYMQGGEFKLDGDYQAHSRAVRDAGLELSAYHYFGPVDDEGASREQARKFVDAAGVLPTLALACDLETRGRATLEPEALADSTAAFLDELDAYTRRAGWLYVGPYFARDNLREQSKRFAGRLLWLPEYGAREPQVPRPFPEASIWQAQGNDGRVPGFAGAVDRNVLGPGVTVEHLRTGKPPRFAPDLGTTRGVQVALRMLGYDVGDFVDGQGGARTAFAVAAFQRQALITPDGIVGEATRAALAATLEAAS